MSNEKIKASYARKNPDSKETIDEKTNNENIPEFLKSDGNNSNSPDIAKLVPAIIALNKYCEPPKSLEPSESNETDKDPEPSEDSKS